MFKLVLEVYHVPNRATLTNIYLKNITCEEEGTVARYSSVILQPCTNMDLKKKYNLITFLSE